MDENRASTSYKENVNMYLLINMRNSPLVSYIQNICCSVLYHLINCVHDILGNSVHINTNNN